MYKNNTIIFIKLLNNSRCVEIIVDTFLIPFPRFLTDGNNIGGRRNFVPLCTAAEIRLNLTDGLIT